ncbi:hypothetical protein FRB98_000075 [Tulasnella sp. 332]|nr:hypothetical protein FRB98_000075 [Tulasnella sp. 332]
MEEAQQIAADYISSLDNLPTEVKFLTEEIRLKEVETMELQNNVNRKIQRANPRLHTNNHSVKDRDRDLAERIKPDLDRIEQLAQAKVALAERLVAIMTRTCGRLDYDLNRVRIASGEVPAVPDLPVISLGSRVPEKVIENVKPVVPIPEPVASPPPQPSVAAPAFKRRRMGGGSINAGTVSNTPIVLSQPALPSRQSRLSNTVNVRPSPPIAIASTRRATVSTRLAPDENGEEQDESADDPADNEDKSLYCFCRKLSYGEFTCTTAMDAFFDGSNESHPALLHCSSAHGQLGDETAYKSHFVSSQLNGSAYFSHHSYSDSFNSNVIDDYAFLSSSAPEFVGTDDLARPEITHRINVPLQQQVPKHEQDQAAVYWSTARVIQDSVQMTPTAADPSQSIHDAFYRELYQDPLDALEPVAVSPGLLSNSSWTMSPGSPAWSSDGQQQHETQGQFKKLVYFSEDIPRSSSYPTWVAPQSLQLEQEKRPFSHDVVPPKSTLLFSNDVDPQRHEFKHDPPITPPASRTQFELRTITSHQASPSSLSTRSLPSSKLCSWETMISSQLQIESKDFGIDDSDRTGGGVESGSERAIDCMVESPHDEEGESTIPILHTDDAASKETLHLRRRCFNCHATEPPSWRRSTLTYGKIVCNKCGLYERTHSRPRPHRFDELLQEYTPLPRARTNSKSTIVGGASTGKPKPRARKGSLAPLTFVSSPSVVNDMDWNIYSIHPMSAPATTLEFGAQLNPPTVRPLASRLQSEYPPPATATAPNFSSNLAPLSTPSRPMAATRKKGVVATRPTQFLARRGTFDVATLSAKKRALKVEKPTDPYRNLQRSAALRQTEMETGWQQIKLEDMMSSFSACPPSSMRGAIRSHSMGDT